MAKKVAEYKDDKHENSDEIICPFCGEETSDSWERSNEDEIECSECCNTFHYSRDIVVTYCSNKIAQKS
jgi:formylmethanofuran dehydrogenase subunit E